MARLAFYLFVSSNNATKQPDDMSDIGQLVTQCSCDMLQTTPPSQTCTIETILFRLVQVVGVSISIFEVYYQCAFSIFLHALHSRFSHRAEEYFSDPTLDMRNARTNTSKAQRRSMLIVYLKLSYNTTNYLYQPKDHCFNSVNLRLWSCL